VSAPEVNAALAAIQVELGRDPHLAKCPLARQSGPDGTCANCGRAMWMHPTRHDTCGAFCWVTEDTLTAAQVSQIAATAGIPPILRIACDRARGLALEPLYVREARQTCAVAINTAKREARRALELASKAP
jgi:hypothetical protein